MEAIKGKGYPITKKEAQNLCFKHMGLALTARKEKNRRLFDVHYQRAGYYLRLMNKLDASWQMAVSQVTQSPQ